MGADQSGRYALGHAEEEVERLEAQARVVDPVTPHARLHTDDVGIDTLLDRMLAETTATGSMVVGHLQCGAYCTV